MITKHSHRDIIQYCYNNNKSLLFLLLYAFSDVFFFFNISLMSVSYKQLIILISSFHLKSIEKKYIFIRNLLWYLATPNKISKNLYLLDVVLNQVLNIPRLGQIKIQALSHIAKSSGQLIGLKITNRKDHLFCSIQRWLDCILALAQDFILFGHHLHKLGK